MDGLFLEALRVELAALDARKFGPDQCCAIIVILGAILRPYLMLTVMRSDSVYVLLSLAVQRRVAKGGLCQCAVKMIFGFLNVRGCGPEQPLRL